MPDAIYFRTPSRKRLYRQGTKTYQINQSMTIHVIGGREIRFNFYCRWYRKFMNSNFGMFNVCFFCIAFMLLIPFYASPKKPFYIDFMLLQRSIVTALLCLSVYFLPLQRSVVTFLIYFSIYFMLCSCYAFWFILCFFKETYLRYYYTSAWKNIFNRIVILSHFWNHNNM